MTNIPKTTRGGKRSGSGRKKNKEPKVNVLAYILPATREFFVEFGDGYFSHGIDRAAALLKKKGAK